MDRLLPLCAAAVLSLSSCSLLSMDDEVSLLCPTPPVSWQIAFPGLGFRVVTLDSHGARLVTDVGDWRIPAAVRCARRVNTPFVAWPFQPCCRTSPVSAPGALRPAGGFYPLSLRDGGDGPVLALSWEDGPAALVIDRVAGEGRDVSRFNVQRLCRFLREHEDPWAVDLDVVAQQIAREELTAWDIDPLPSRSVEVSPGPGTWFLESPFSPTFPASGGKVLLPLVPLGTHRLFALSGQGWALQVNENDSYLAPGT